MADFTSLIVYFEATDPSTSGMHGLYIRAAPTGEAADALVATAGLLASLGVTDAGSLRKSAAAVVIPRTPRFITPQHGYYSPSGVASIAVGPGGSGYATPPPVTIAAPGGSIAIQATATAVVAAGAVTEIRVTNVGEGYDSGSPPSVTIGGPGTGATATATVGGVMQAEPLVRFPMRALIRAYHERLEYLGTLIEEARAHNRPPAHITFAESVLFGMHQWAWGIWHDTRLNNTHRVNAFALQAQGPTDMYPADYPVVARRNTQIYDRENPSTFADVVTRLTPAQISGARFDSFSFVNIDKTNLSTAFSRRSLWEAADPDSTLIVSVDGEGNAVLPDPLYHLRDGAWIDEVNA